MGSICECHMVNLHTYELWSLSYNRELEWTVGNEPIGGPTSMSINLFETTTYHLLVIIAVR